MRKTPGYLLTPAFRADVQLLQGWEWLGYYRKRGGDYRIIFLIHRGEGLVDLKHVASEKTCR